jgi:hypothetical protein
LAWNELETWNSWTTPRSGLELPEADARRTAAFHEAGHAVAAVMRGGSSLTSVSLDEHLHGEGITWSRALVFDQPFLIWAGPWAEARHA